MPAYDVLLMADYGCYLWSDEPKLQRYRQPMERYAAGGPRSARPA